MMLFSYSWRCNSGHKLRVSLKGELQCREGGGDEATYWTVKDKWQHLRVCLFQGPRSNPGKSHKLVLVPVLRLSLLLWTLDIWRSGCVSFCWTQSMRSHCDGSLASFMADFALCSIPALGLIPLSRLGGFPHYWVVTETETVRKMSAIHLWLGVHTWSENSKLYCIRYVLECNAEQTYRLPYCAVVSFLMLCCLWSSSMMFRSCLSVWKVSLGSWMVNLEYSSCSRWGPWYTAMLAHASIEMKNRIAA